MVWLHSIIPNTFELTLSLSPGAGTGTDDTFGTTAKYRDPK